MDSKRLAEYSIIFVGAVIIMFLLRQFQSFMRPLSIALIISFLFTPVYRLSNTKRIMYYAKMGIIIILAIGLLAGMGSMMFSGATKIIESNSPETFQEKIMSASYSIAGYEMRLSKIADVDKMVVFVGNVVKYTINSIRNFLSEIFLVIIFLAFLLPSINVWIKNITAKMKPCRRKRFYKTLEDMETGVRDYLKIKTIISLGTGLISLLVLLLFDAKLPFILASLIFALNYIPNVGSIIAVCLALIVQIPSIGLGFVGLAVCLILVQIIFANFLEPKLMGKSLKLSPLTVILSLFFWGAVWGIGGMLFSVPFTLAIKILLQHKGSKITKFL
ncbi:MAG: AI-2E family transporter [Nanoarchaeota archaeon]